MTANGEIYRAGLPQLGARLLAAAGFVRAHHAAADIGCDHGKLPVWLALRGVCPRVIAVDSRPMPLAKARALVRQTGCEAVVDCRLGQGLAPLAPREASDIVIAGLSGETMRGILEACDWLRQAGVRLVLVPTTRHALLRGWLCQAGFAIVAETPVLEHKRPYAVMCADYTGECRQATALFCEVGLVPQTPGPAAQEYINRRLEDLHNRGLGLADPEQRRQHQQLVKEVKACLQ